MKNNCKCGLKLKETWKVCPECMTKIKSRDEIMMEFKEFKIKTRASLTILAISSAFISIFLMFYVLFGNS